MKKKPLPKDLGGYQLVVNGNIRSGDLLITGHSNTRKVFWAQHAIGCPVAAMDGDTRVYRQMPQPIHDER